jgi:hypothetical protein
MQYLSIRPESSGILARAGLLDWGMTQPQPAPGRAKRLDRTRGPSKGLDGQGIQLAARGRRHSQHAGHNTRSNPALAPTQRGRNQAHRVCRPGLSRSRPSGGAGRVRPGRGRPFLRRSFALPGPVTPTGLEVSWLSRLLLVRGRCWRGARWSGTVCLTRVLLQTVEQGDHPTNGVQRRAQLGLGQVSEAIFPQGLPADALAIHDGTPRVG